MHTLEINGKTYIPFRAGLKHPKFSWVTMMLNKYGIPHVVKNTTLQGPMLYVEQGTLELAQGILGQELAVFLATTTNFEDGPAVEIRVIIDDLPHDHEFFAVQIRNQEITKIVPTPVEDPAPAVRVDRGVPVDTLEVIEVEGKVIEDDEPTLESITGEIAEHLADESLEAVTDNLMAQVHEELADPDLEDDDDEDDWGFDEVSLEAEDEPEEAPVKKKKVKSEPKEANDPDFEEAEPAKHQTAPVTGTEFLKADQLLEFEDVLFPKVKLPIRMYDVNSSNLSAIGVKITEDPLIATMYIRFKTGAAVYRYNPVATADWNETLNQAVRAQQGIQEASVGSFYYHTIKVKAESGEIKCQRLNEDGTAWVQVLPKAARTKDIKERAK